MIRVAVDGMGGDYAPEVVVAGAVQAANDFDHIEVVLVGQEEALKRELKKHKLTGGKLTVRHASEVVTMSDTPVAAIKKKKDSSIAVCVDMLQKREVDAIVSAGNTGAAVAASTLRLGMLKGVKRPGIAISTPSLQGMSVVMDVGANLNPSPTELLHYAIMASVYSKSIFKKRHPSIGLLNIGEEECKGTDVIQEAHKLLRDTSLLNFIGNIEGRDFFNGKADCIVCDGFVGNVVLKLLESVLETSKILVKRNMQKNPLSYVGAYFMKPAIKSVLEDINYEEAGGAPLLGVDGIVIIGHGISSAKAIRNAIRKGAEFVSTQVNEQIVEVIAGLKSAAPEVSSQDGKSNGGAV